MFILLVKNLISLAISIGWARRFSGIFDSISLSSSSLFVLAVKSVSVNPGETELTRQFLCAYSKANVLTNPVRANLVAPYTLLPFLADTAQIEETMTM